MGATLDSLVAVNISLATLATQQKGFGRGLILGSSNRMGSDLYRVYTGTAGMLTDGFLATDKEYIAALKYFSQPIAPKDVMVGYAPTASVAQVEVIKVVTATNSFNYAVTVNGETAVYLSDSSATAAEIVAGLVTAINLLSGAAAYTAAATSGTTDRLQITAAVAGTAFTLSLGTTKLAKPQYELVTVAVVTNSALYQITVNGQVASYTSDSSATATEIQLGLVAAVNLLVATGVTAAAVSTDKLSLIADVEGTPFSFSITATALTSAGTTPNAVGGVATGLTAIIAAGGKDWYGLVMTQSRAKADILDAAAWIEAQAYAYTYIACSSDSDVLTTSTSDVLSTMKALSYLRTAYIWSDDQAHFPEAAWYGKELPTTPGSSNFAFKTLTGITPTVNSVLTDAKIAILEGKNGNYYMSVGGNSITQSGKMVGGQFIDVVIGRDWIKFDMQAGVFNVMLNTPKVGFTNDGIASLRNAVNNTLQTAVNNGILASYDIPLIKASDFSSAQRATRVLPSLPWSAVLEGAINGLTINGTITA